MEKKFDIAKFSDFVFNLFQNVEKNDLEYIYRGNITPNLVANVLDLAKSNLTNTDPETKRVKSRIYFIMGEGLQNVTRHQENITKTVPDTYSIVVINKRKTKYTITTGNVIKKQEIPPLKEKIEKINQMTINELREFARFIRKTQGVSDKGGASLGLVEMAKRSGKQLLYSFQDINFKISYFYFNTEILTNDHEKTTELRPYDKKYLDKIIEFHKYLNQENVLLSFKGDFSQENVIYLLEILRGQMPETTSSIKINNILIELLQNIEKHADNVDDITDWKPGIFLINSDQDKYYLTAANYMLHTKRRVLEKKISFVNSLDRKELLKYYKENLLNLNGISAKKTGLGIIDIRKKSANKLNFHFTEINDKYSFFLIQASVNKNKQLNKS